MDHISILKISPVSDCGKHTQATVWLPWEELHDPNKIFYKELKKTTRKNTKQPINQIKKKSHYTHTLKKKKVFITYHRAKVAEKKSLH